MLTFNNITKKLFAKRISFDEFVANAKEECRSLQRFDASITPQDHRYSLQKAQEELGLDEPLIDSLLEDFVEQILNTISLFEDYLDTLRQEQEQGKRMNFTPLRDLAHKNLGVARNLRIADIQKILTRMMHEEDIKRIERYVAYLRACTILLKPKLAYSIFYP